MIKEVTVDLDYLYRLINMLRNGSKEDGRLKDHLYEFSLHINSLALSFVLRSLIGYINFTTVQFHDKPTSNPNYLISKICQAH